MINKAFKEYKIYLCRKLMPKKICKQCDKRKKKLQYQYNFEQEEKYGR